MTILAKGAHEDVRLIAAIAVVRDRDAQSAAEVTAAWEAIGQAGLDDTIRRAAFFDHDAAQSASIKALRAIENFDPARVKGSPVALLAVAARRGVVDEQQRANRRQVDRLPSTGSPEEPIARSDDAREDETAEALTGLGPILTQILSPRELAVFIAQGKGQKYASVARANGLTTKQVDASLQRARRKIAGLRRAAQLDAREGVTTQAAALVEFFRGRSRGRKGI